MISKCLIRSIILFVKHDLCLYLANNLQSGAASFLQVFAIFEKLSEGNTGGTKRSYRTGNLLEPDQPGMSRALPTVWGLLWWRKAHWVLHWWLSAGQVLPSSCLHVLMEIACWSNSDQTRLCIGSHQQTPGLIGPEKTRWRTPGWLVGTARLNSQVQTVA